MKPALLVVARGTSALNKFEQGSLLEAINIRDFLEETGDYVEVSIFQRLPAGDTTRKWVRLNDLDC
jgi:hypothetical protein